MSYLLQVTYQLSKLIHHQVCQSEHIFTDVMTYDIAGFQLML